MHRHHALATQLPPHIGTAFRVHMRAAHEIPRRISANTHQTKVAATMIISHVPANFAKQAGMCLSVAGVEYRMPACGKTI
jgi:hypothetical protein